MLWYNDGAAVTLLRQISFLEALEQEKPILIWRKEAVCRFAVRIALYHTHTTLLGTHWRLLYRVSTSKLKSSTTIMGFFNSSKRKVKYDLINSL